MKRLLLTLLFSLPCSAQQWNTLGNPAAFGQSAVYDSVTQQMIVYGGNNGSQVLGQTFAWDTTTTYTNAWSELSYEGTRASLPGKKTCS